MLLIIFSDKPFVTKQYRTVDCDAGCNFTVDSNPAATFVSLEDEGDHHNVMSYA